MKLEQGWIEARAFLDRLLELSRAESRALLERLRRGEISARTLSSLETCADDDFLGRSVGEVAPDLLAEVFAGDDAGEDCTGRRYGRWRVVTPLGEGGMGRVFLVERSDGQYEMQAALKLLAGERDPRLAERFRLERQILARLDHPHVARLLDGGTTEDGQPWLVMERIDGEPIDSWCEVESLGVRSRLRLFLQVCAAVAHAHRQLIVHLDIKPGNVLIDPEGKARLLDFGIARLVADRGPDDRETGASVSALTPGYAAPEQIRGEPASTATDVYALGALLYRLLTARTPFGDGTPDARETIRRTLVEPPAPASSAAADPLLARKLRGDLDAIVAKALAKEPEERYPSAVELAADVTRHLDDLPVIARPATHGVRLRKLIRRHRLGAAVVVLATTLAIGILMVGLARLREAERDRERAESVTAFLTEVLEVGDPAEGGGYTLATDDLLHRALERAEARLDGRPALQAAVFHQVGELLLKLGLYEDAREALTRAITLRREVAPRGSHELADSLARYGYTFQHSPRSIEGLPALREAVRISRRLYGERDPRVADALLELAVYISRLIPREYQSDRLGTEAADGYEQALDLYRRAYGEAHPKIPETLHNMAFSRQDTAQRIDLLEQAVRGYEALGSRSPDLAYALSDLGLVYEERGRAEDAEIVLGRSLEILRAREDDDLRVELTIANNLAGVLRDRGRYAEAAPLYREVLRDRERVVPGNDRTRAFTLYGLGRSLLGLGEASEAEPYLRDAATILEEEGAEFLAAVARGWVAEALHVQGRAREAEALARASYRTLRSSAGEGHQETVTARERLERLTTTSSGPASAGPASNLREGG